MEIEINFNESNTRNLQKKFANGTIVWIKASRSYLKISNKGKKNIVSTN